MLMAHDGLRSQDIRLEGVSVELAENKQALQSLEAELEKQPTNPYLLKKYERLSRREELLLEERKLWAALLSRLVLASAPNADVGDFPDVQRAITAANIAHHSGFDSEDEPGRHVRRYNTRQAVAPSPDKAQLMLLADAADAGLELGESSDASRKKRKKRPSTAFSLLSKRGAGGDRFKPFHVAKTVEHSDGSDEGYPIEVPVSLSLEDRLAEYARGILDRSAHQPLREAHIAPDEIPSDSSRESHGDDVLQIAHPTQGSADGLPASKAVEQGESRAAEGLPPPLPATLEAGDPPSAGVSGSDPSILDQSKEPHKQQYQSSVDPLAGDYAPDAPESGLSGQRASQRQDAPSVAPSDIVAQHRSLAVRAT